MRFQCFGFLNSNQLHSNAYFYYFSPRSSIHQDCRVNWYAIQYLKMAAEQMKKVATHLTCPICYELYKKPKYLRCYHSYCEECLVKLQKTDSTNITCPECRKTSAIPTGGIKQLPNNFFINRIVDEVALKEKVTGEENVHCDFCIREDPAVVF